MVREVRTQGRDDPGATNPEWVRSFRLAHSATSVSWTHYSHPRDGSEPRVCLFENALETLVDFLPAATLEMRRFEHFLCSTAVRGQHGLGDCGAQRAGQTLPRALRAGLPGRLLRSRVNAARTDRMRPNHRHKRAGEWPGNGGSEPWILTLN